MFGSPFHFYKFTAVLALASLPIGSGAHSLEIQWLGSGQDIKPLGVWSLNLANELVKKTARLPEGSLRAKKLREKNPNTGKIESFEGYRISIIVEQLLKKLDLPRQSWVDLITIVDPGGKRLNIPRAFIVKYPVILAKVGEGFRTIVPLTTQSKKIQGEVLPVQKYHFVEVSKIELTNYRARYGQNWFVKEGRDPLVVRGQRRFLQTCFGCHNQQTLHSKPWGSGDFVQEFNQAHQSVGDLPKYEFIDLTGIKRFLDEVKRTNDPIAKNGGE